MLWAQLCSLTHQSVRPCLAGPLQSANDARGLVDILETRSGENLPDREPSLAGYACHDMALRKQQSGATIQT